MRETEAEVLAGCASAEKKQDASDLPQAATVVHVLNKEEVTMNTGLFGGA